MCATLCEVLTAVGMNMELNHTKTFDRAANLTTHMEQKCVLLAHLYTVKKKRLF